MSLSMALLLAKSPSTCCLMAGTPSQAWRRQCAGRLAGLSWNWAEMSVEHGVRDSALLGARVGTRRSQRVRVDSCSEMSPWRSQTVSWSLGNGPPRGGRPVGQGGRLLLAGPLSRAPHRACAFSQVAERHIFCGCPVNVQSLTTLCPFFPGVRLTSLRPLHSESPACARGFWVKHAWFGNSIHPSLASQVS